MMKKAIEELIRTLSKESAPFVCMDGQLNKVLRQI